MNPFSFHARLAGALLLACFAFQGRAVGGVFQKKSTSESGQFVVYCDDLAVRLRITGLVEDEKRGVLKLLGAKDEWKYPIVVNVERISAAAPGIPVSQVRLIEVDGGFKVELDLCLGADPRNLRLEEQIIRAVLLEYSYRLQPPDQAGATYNEPPPWLIEGAVEIFRSREAGTKADVYKALIDSNEVPKFEDFLGQRSLDLDSTSLALYRACSLGLVELLMELPRGPAGLAAYLRDPERDNTSVEILKKHFPALATGGQSLEKWWSLSLARLSASERYKGLTLEETDQRLTALLTFQVQITLKTGSETKTFALDQFKDYLKYHECRNALDQLGRSLTALDAIGSPPIRPVIFEYEKITMDLAHGKAHGIAERIASAEKVRRMTLKRMSDIADYMNWFEATQMTELSDTFDGYMKTAAELSAPPARRQDPISRYLDNIEIEFQ